MPWYDKHELRPDWNYIKKVGDGWPDDKEETKAMQVFFRVVRWLTNLLEEDPAREFMLKVVDPDPIIDWDTGLELGDPCPKHGKPLSCFPVPDGPEIHLECIDCGRHD